jgi:hypothetical protein
MQTLWFLSLCCEAIPTEIHSHPVLSSDVSKAIVAAAQNASAQVSVRHMLICSVCQSGVLDFDHADARCPVCRRSRLLQLRTIFTALSKPGAEACGDDAAAALQRHKDRFPRLPKLLLPALLTFHAGRAREKATSWQKDVSDAHDKWTVELTKRYVSTVLS